MSSDNTHNGNHDSRNHLTDHPNPNHLTTSATNPPDSNNPSSEPDEGVAEGFESEEHSPTISVIPPPQPAPSSRMGINAPVPLAPSGSHGTANGCSLLQEAQINHGVPGSDPDTSMAMQNAVPHLSRDSTVRSFPLSQKLLERKPVKRKLWEVDHEQTAAQLERELTRVTEEDERRFRQRWEVLPPQFNPEAPSFYFSQVVSESGKEALGVMTSSLTSNTPPASPADVRRVHVEAKRRRVDSSVTCTGAESTCSAMVTAVNGSRTSGSHNTHSNATSSSGPSPAPSPTTTSSGDTPATPTPTTSSSAPSQATPSPTTTSPGTSQSTPSPITSPTTPSSGATTPSNSSSGVSSANSTPTGGLAATPTQQTTTPTEQTATPIPPTSNRQDRTKRHLRM